ncbi:MAG TPA: WXG100 family type VII secretion target [Ktedonobacteraceae bacterium]
MSDMTGGRTHVMDATATRFVHQAEDFKTSLANITSAVQSLMNDWWGQSPQAYQHAMSKWDKDAKAIVADLEEISHSLKGSSSALTELDADLAKMFNGLGG